MRRRHAHAGRQMNFIHKQLNNQSVRDDLRMDFQKIYSATGQWEFYLIIVSICCSFKPNWIEFAFISLEREKKDPGKLVEELFLAVNISNNEFLLMIIILKNCFV